MLNSFTNRSKVEEQKREIHAFKEGNRPEDHEKEEYMEEGRYRNCMRVQGEDVRTLEENDNGTGRGDELRNKE